MNFFAILLFIVLLRVTYQGVLSTIRVQQTFLFPYKKGVTEEKAHGKTKQISNFPTVLLSMPQNKLP